MKERNIILVPKRSTKKDLGVRRGRKTLWNFILKLEILTEYRTNV